MWVWGFVQKILSALGVVFVCAAFAQEARPATQGGPTDSGTQKMVERLKQIADSLDPLGAAYLMTAERCDAIRSLLQTTISPEDRLKWQKEYAFSLLNAGFTDKAIKAFNDYKKAQLADSDPKEAQYVENMVNFYLAICYLRKGEQDNCLVNHNAESCLFPIAGNGVHILPEGSNKAKEYLLKVLQHDPGNKDAVWLLNIAAMTLGEYPEQVPQRWRIPPKVFDSSYDIQRFPDVAGGTGLDVNGLAGGSVMDDFDRDDDLDLMVSSWGLRDQLRYFQNNGDGTFTEKTNEMGLKGLVRGLNMIQGDYNNDGYVDVLVLRGAWLKDQGEQPNSLLRNNAGKSFSDVTEEAGVLSFHPTQTAAWLDFNNDGWLDLFIGNEHYGDRVHPCELYRNNGDGTFTDVASETGADIQAFVKGVACGDYDNDGWTDLYLSISWGKNILLRNNGPQKSGTDGSLKWSFTPSSRRAGVTEPVYSFPTWFFDYDNDGWLDLFVASSLIKGVGDFLSDYLGLPHRAARARLFHNLGNGRFEDVTKETHLYKILHGMGSNFGDLDNDGFLDFYIGTGDPSLTTLTPNRMFRNHEGRYFDDVTTSGGFGHLQKGHGVAFGDIDNDGDEDVYAVLGGAYSGDVYRNVLFQNPGHGNQWIKLKLEGVQSNRSAIGARIKVVLNQAGKKREVHRVVNSGGSFGANPLMQQIGLGKNASIERVEILWPVTGQTQIFEDLKPDSAYHIVEGDSEAKPFTVPSFKIQSSSSVHSRHEH